MARCRALALIASVAFLPGCGGSEDEPPSACDVGAQRSEGPIKDATLLACGTTPKGPVELWAWRDGAGPCVVVVGLPGGPRGCARAPSERVPPSEAALGGPAIVRRTARGPLELYAETGPSVAQVVVSYRRADNGQVRRTATVIKVDDGEALRAARIQSPFGFMVTSVPGSATRVTAEGRDDAGAARGRLRFGPVIESMHPTAFLLTEPTG